MTSTSHAFHRPARRSLRALDWANFFLADVRDGVAMAAMGIATVLAQTPAGAFIDNSNNKRLIMAVASAVVAVCCILMTIPAFVNLYAIVFFQVLMGCAAAVLLPGIAAITLGMVGYKKFPERQGRNQMFNHAGNVLAAICAGLLGHFIAREFLFYAVVLFALASMISVLNIQRTDIDNSLARGARKSDEEDDDETQTSGFLTVFASKTVLIFALSIVLFHFANAAMLPLVDQYLTVGTISGASLYMSACIITAQLIMIPMAKFAGHFADIWERKPVFLIGFAALPIRGFLYTVSDNPYWLVAVQAMDGSGARRRAQQRGRRFRGRCHQLPGRLYLSRLVRAIGLRRVLLRRAGDAELQTREHRQSSRHWRSAAGVDLRLRACNKMKILYEENTSSFPRRESS